MIYEFILHTFSQRSRGTSTYGEKSWRQLHKNATSCIRQVLEATSKKNSSCSLLEK